jgi:hypothetical protein
VRCLFAHKWVVKVGNVTFTSHAKAVLYYRTCDRCGVTQRGLDSFDGAIPWETMRERSYIEAQQIQIVRQRSSGLGQLAHTLGLRRTRASDGMGPGTEPR